MILCVYVYVYIFQFQGVKEKEEPSEAEVTEMEVKIDPMIILQCCLDVDDENSIYKEDNKETEPRVDHCSDQQAHFISVGSVALESNIDERKPYVCDICSRKYTSEIALQNHMWSHAPYPNRIFNSYNLNEIKPQLQLQYMEDRQDGPEMSSSDEKEEEDDSDDLEHDHDYPTKRVTCPICGKIISTKGNLKVHLETHRPKGRYGCDICGRM